MQRTLPVAQRGKLPIRWLLLAVLAPLAVCHALFGALGIRHLSVEAFEANGPSMEPTLLHGDRFVLDRSAYGMTLPLAQEAWVTWREPDAGDVIVLDSPADDVSIIKRVIGAGGDRIEIRDDVVYRNGESIQHRVLGPCPAPLIDCELVEERVGARIWQTARSPLAMPDTLSAVEVPRGHVFVLGDRRDRSNDSRNPAIGMIPSSRVRGRAVRIYWSADGHVRWDRVGQEVR